jgi:hypothetical protein
VSNVAVAAPLLEWLALSPIPGLGPTKSRKLVGTGIHAVSAQSLATGKWAELAREEIARAAGAGVAMVAMDDPSYPRLKEIYDPPLILYVRGSVDVLTKPGIAMVGTRHPTPYGSGMAERLAGDLAAPDWSLSGAWREASITARHRGAISAQGKTLAVFGTGSRRDLCQGKLSSVRADSRARWRPHFRVSAGYIRRAAELSHSQPHSQRKCLSACSWSRPRNTRHTHHRPLRARAESRRFRRSRQRHQQKLLETKHAHQAGQAWGRPGKTCGRISQPKYDLR